jgi:hypothetical protein
MSLTPEQIAARLAERNPFATRSVRPGVITYRFVDGRSTVELIESLREHAWRGEIVGPHGSGKSTLLHSLIPGLRAAGRDVKHFTLHSGQSRFPVSGTDMQTWGPNSQVIIDGYEQLGGWTRTLITRVCHRQGCGLLVASHESAGFYLLARTVPTLELIQTIVSEIQPGESPRIFDHDVQLSFDRHRGNIREVFFELYDLYEQRRG